MKNRILAASKGNLKFSWLTVLAVLILVALSGCIDQGDTNIIKYSNDIITVEERVVSTLNPYAGSTTTIDFLVQNNGDRIEGVDVEVNFFDIPGFNVTRLHCQNNETLAEGIGCYFRHIPPLDVRKVALTLQAPPSDIIATPTTFTLSYYIAYNYTGYRKADIPVIDDITRHEPIAKFSQSTPSYGPVVFDFEPPVGREKKEDGKIIKEYWGVQGRPFEVKMRIEHVGSSSVGSVQPINISKGSVKLELKGDLRRAKGFPCNFCNATRPGDCPSEMQDVLIGKDGRYLFSEKDVIVPSELMCNFETTKTTQPEVIATIWAEFSYTYKYIRTETFTVQPIPK